MVILSLQVVVWLMLNRKLNLKIMKTLKNDAGEVIGYEITPQIIVHDHEDGSNGYWYLTVPNMDIKGVILCGKAMILKNICEIVYKTLQDYSKNANSNLEKIKLIHSGL